MNQKKIGKFITENRKKKNLTQEELAKTLGVTSRTVLNWENGKCLPDYSLLIPLCDTLEISIDELINGKEDKTSKDSLEMIIEYLDRNRQVNLKQKQTIGKILLIGGVLLTLFIIFFIPRYAVYYDINIYVYISILLSILGFNLINNKYHFKKRIILNIIFIVSFICFLTVQDTLNIIINNQPPRFYTAALDERVAETYQTVFYDVYRCFNQDNKFHIVSKNKIVDFTNNSFMSPAYYYCDETP